MSSVISCYRAQEGKASAGTPFLAPDIKYSLATDKIIVGLNKLMCRWTAVVRLNDETGKVGCTSTLARSRESCMP